MSVKKYFGMLFFGMGITAGFTGEHPLLSAIMIAIGALLSATNTVIIVPATEDPQRQQ